MMNASRRISGRISICGALLVLGISASAPLQAHSQTTAPVTALGRQLAKVELGISGVGELTGSSQGLTYLPQMLYQKPSKTAGVYVDLNYQKSPLIGFQLNFTQFRYAQNYSVVNVAGTPSGQHSYILDVQAKTNEYSFGYLARPTIFGLHTFAGAGLGAIEYHPTAGGGEGLVPQERVGIYYEVGIEQPLFENFGVRLQLRQVFQGAPDFNQNYLATGARVSTIEPGVGFYVRF
jgi:hypothetical protein